MTMGSAVSVLHETSRLSSAVAAPVPPSLSLMLRIWMELVTASASDTMVVSPIATIAKASGKITGVHTRPRF